MKTRLIFSLVLIALSAVPNISIAQVLNDISPSTWEVSSHEDMTNEQAYNSASLIKINVDQIMWGPSEDQMMDFDIDGFTGSWDKVTNTGNLTLDITTEGMTGTATIDGSNGDIKIKFVLTSPDVNSEIELLISTVTYE